MPGKFAMRRLMGNVALWCRPLAVAILVMGVVAVPPVASAQPFERATLTGTFADQQFLAGGQVTVEAEIADDLFVAGGKVTIERSRVQDIIAAGGSLRLRQVAASDLILAGGTVDIEAEIADDVVAAGGTVHVGSSTTIAGDAWLAGGSVDVEGRIGGRLMAAGGSLHLDGEIEGDVDLTAGAVTIGPNARLGGALVYRSDEAAAIDPAAVIAGGVQRLDMPVRGKGRSLWQWVLFGLAAWLGLLVAIGIAAAALQAAVPGLLSGAAANITNRPFAALGLGFLIALATPVLAIALFATLIGTPLALILILALALAVATGGIATAHWLGHAILRRGSPEADRAGWASRIAATALGLLALALLAVIPFIGFVATAIALMLGLGALVPEAWSRLRPPSHP